MPSVQGPPRHRTPEQTRQSTLLPASRLLLRLDHLLDDLGFLDEECPEDTSEYEESGGGCVKCTGGRTAA